MGRGCGGLGPDHSAKISSNRQRTEHECKGILFPTRRKVKAIATIGVRNAHIQARLKVYRANRHINEVGHLFQTYANSDFYNLIDDRDPETGKQSIRLEATPLDANLILAIGDTFHCLSSALEYVMSGLMRAKTGDAKRISFPTDETREALRKSFMLPRPGKRTPPNRRIVEAPPLLVLELLTVIKPYKGGDFGLWEIRKADNIDKHNLIIPIITIAAVTGIDMVDKVHNNVMTNMTMVVGAGGVLNAIGYQNAGSYLEFTNKGHASVSITFADGSEVFDGKPVLPTLIECLQLTAQALERIEAVVRRYL